MKCPVVKNNMGKGLGVEEHMSAVVTILIEVV